MEKQVAALVSILCAVLSKAASEDSGPDFDRRRNQELESMVSVLAGDMSQTEWSRTCAAVRQMLGAR